MSIERWTNPAHRTMQYVAASTPEREAFNRILLVVHGVTPFAESLTGFGIGVTIGIPLLAHFGLPARTVAVIGLLGLCAVPWGSMGPGTLIAATMSGLSFHDLGVTSAAISLIPFVVTGIIAASTERCTSPVVGPVPGGGLKRGIPSRLFNIVLLYAKRLHSENAELWPFDGCVAGRFNPKRDDASGIYGINNAVVPKARGRIIRRAFIRVLCQNRSLEFGGFRIAKALAFSRKLFLLYGQQNIGRLFAAHYAYSGIRPHP